MCASASTSFYVWKLLANGVGAYANRCVRIDVKTHYDYAISANFPIITQHYSNSPALKISYEHGYNKHASMLYVYK